MKPAYYNEIDPFAAAWLRELIAAGEIAPGDVDTRSITDVRADDLVPYGQCHFFAGIGGWSLALRLAGVPDDVPVWSGSCPCQPFSVAGKGRGTADERHLWPELRRLIAERRPAVCLGEQVSGRAGLDWLAAVRADLEGLDYVVGAADLCAAGVGAPHIRQRIYWGGMGNPDRQRRDGFDALLRASQGGRVTGRVPQAVGTSEAGGGMGDADHAGLGRRKRGAVLGARRREEGRATSEPGASSGELWPRGGVGMENPGGTRLEGRRRSDRMERPDQQGWRAGVGSEASVWGGGGWVDCSDGRSRPTAPLARRVDDGVPARVVLLRGYGNAIVPQVGAAFVRSFLKAAGVTA